MRTPHPAFPLTAAAALAAAIASAPLLAQMPPSQVRVAPVQVVETQDMEMATGNLRARRRAAVAALESARVDEVLFQEGQAVAEGDVLVRLDRRRLVIDLAEAEARREQVRTEIGVARAELEKAEADLAAYRAAERAKQGSVSGITLRQAVRDVAVGNARVQSANRALAQSASVVERLQVRLEDMDVRAPFAARVVTRSVQVGEWVNAGTPVATLVSTGALEVWIELPERVPQNVVAARDTLPVRIVSLDLLLTGRSVRVIPDIDPRSRRYFAVAIVDGGENPDEPVDLAPGMSVTVSVPGGGKADRRVVPSDAILRDGGGHYVYKAQKAGEDSWVAMPVSVKLGFGRGKEEVVLTQADGLQDGDLVVVEGSERLRPGAPIAIQNAAAGDGSPGKRPAPEGSDNADPDKKKAGGNDAGKQDASNKEGGGR